MNKRKAFGCLTCKVRKIKCDETKPYCLRCLRTGRTCDGYQTPSSTGALISLTHPVSASPSFESQEEARAFDYYLQKSSKVLSGELDAEIWSKLIVQLSVTEPAVRHAIVAISSLHRGSSRGQGLLLQDDSILDHDQRFGLIQYSRAMKVLSSWQPVRDDHNKTTLPLILCLLFVAVEFLKGDQQTSQIHICQGRKIIAELGEHDLDPGVTAFLRDNVIPMYQRLGLACYLFGSIPPPIPRHLRAFQDLMDGGSLEFRSVEQARDQLYNMLDEVLQFVNLAQSAAYTTEADANAMLAYDRQRLAEEEAALLSRLERWNNALIALTVTLPSSALPTKTVHLLRVYYHIAKTWVSVSLVPSEVVFDQHVDSFASIINNSLVILDALAVKTSSASAEHNFSFETEVIAPLYWVCIKCRQPTLRRAALKLLQRHELRSRRENLWNTEAIASVSNLVITAEEDASRVQGITFEDEPSPQESFDKTTTSHAEFEGAADNVSNLSSNMSSNMPEQPRTNLSTTHVQTPNHPLLDSSQMQQSIQDTLSSLESTVYRDPEEKALLQKLLRIPAHQPPTVSGLADRDSLLSFLDQNQYVQVQKLDSTGFALTSGSALPEAVRDGFTSANVFSRMSFPAPEKPKSARESDSHQPQRAAAGSSTLIPQTSYCFTSPFGVPESARIKNLILGPSNNQGMWVTMFRDPPPGKKEWDVIRNFLYLDQSTEAQSTFHVSRGTSVIPPVF